MKKPDTQKIIKKREEMKIWIKDYNEVCEKLNIKIKFNYNDKTCPDDVEENICKIIYKELNNRFNKALYNQHIDSAKKFYILEQIKILYDSRIFITSDQMLQMIKCNKKSEVNKLRDKFGGFTW